MHEAADRLKAEGEPVARIAAMTGLSVEESARVLRREAELRDEGRGKVSSRSTGS